MQLWPNVIFASCQVSVAGGIPTLQGSNGPVVDVEDLGVGHYMVNLRAPGVPYWLARSMTCVGAALAGTYAQIVADIVSETEIEVFTYNAAGVALDSSFSLLVLANTVNGGSAPTPPPAGLILDDITDDVFAAWSVSDRLKSTHVTPLFLLRRLSDNTTTPIGYTAGNVMDQAAVAAFCGVAVGTVVTTYNQATLDPFDLTADAAANEPVIYTGGAVNVQGAANTPAMILNGLNDFGDVGGSYLRRNDALGLTGNPGIVAWYNYVHNVSSLDKFPWSIGTTGGGQYSSMTSQVNGPAARMSGSTLAGNYNALDPNRTVWGNYRHVWPAAGTVADQTIFRDGTALAFDSTVNPGSSPALVNLWTAWGCSTFANASFSADGEVSSLFLMEAAADNPVTNAIMQAWMDARN